ncbi:MAG TPA: tyrosine-type recombinase/integrase, partial [Nannocystis sp.]
GQDLHVRRSIAVVRGERRIYAPKSGRARTLPLSPRLAAVLRELAADSPDGWLFHQRCGRPAVRRQVETWLRDVVRKAGTRPISPHALRHGFASQLLRARVDPETVKCLMGHASLKTLEIYTHSTNASRRGAIASLLTHRGVGTDLTRAEGASARRQGKRAQVREITSGTTAGRGSW